MEKKSLWLLVLHSTQVFFVLVYVPVGEAVGHRVEPYVFADFFGHLHLSGDHAQLCGTPHLDHDTLLTGGFIGAVGLAGVVKEVGF